MRSSVGSLLKTGIFTILVPGTAVGVVPWWLRHNAPIALAGPQRWAAFAIIAAGIAISLHTAFWGFALIGGGTPAPIDPPKRLVVTGLHRLVRNPMYIGVLLVIGGQAWLFRSLPTTIYLACFGIAAHLFVVFYEEPTLRRQFGEEYEQYCASVPRWIPKIRF